MESKTTNGQDGKDIKSYNIAGKLSGVGRSILCHVIHEMDDSHEIQHFLSLSGCIKDAMLDKYFKWGTAPALSNSYSFNSVPVGLTDLVCYFCCIFPLF